MQGWAQQLAGGRRGDAWGAESAPGSWQRLAEGQTLTWERWQTAERLLRSCVSLVHIAGDNSQPLERSATCGTPVGTFSALPSSASPTPVSDIQLSSPTPFSPPSSWNRADQGRKPHSLVLTDGKVRHANHSEFETDRAETHGHTETRGVALI